MRHAYVILAGMAYGLTMRLLFGLLGHLGPGSGSAATGPMLVSFVLVVPLIIGFLTVYLAAPEKRTPGRSLLMPWLPITLFSLGCGLLLIEGSICIAMALPVFCVAGSLGGFLTWALLRLYQPGGRTVSALAVLPLLLALGESRLDLPQTPSRVRTSMHVDAEPDAIWRLINDAPAITPDEMRGGLAWWIGVPYPVSAQTVETPQGRVRKLRWARGIAFDEPITDWQENRYIRWTYRFDEHSFPADTLDEHVLIGGRHFDLLDTSYALIPEPGGTRLEIVIDYRVSTGFNWYAGTVGRELVENAADTILRFYARRSESERIASRPGMTALLH